MGCISSLAKYIIFLFNFLISVCAIILIVFGILFVINENQGVALFSEFTAGGFAIGVGIIIFFIAFLGCCGAIKENSCMLTSYAIVLIIIFVLQVVLSIIIFVRVSNHDDLYTEVHKQIESLFKKSDEDSKDAIDVIQQTFKCCGVDGPNYWTPPYPSSCCEDKPSICIKPYGAGCAAKFTDAMEDSAQVIGGVAIGFAVVELLGAIFAFMVRNRGREYA